MTVQPIVDNVCSAGLAATVTEIPLPRLALAFLPVAVVLAIFFRWSIAIGTSLVAFSRMLIQLFTLGYVLQFVFDTNSPQIVLLVLSVMVLVAGWISLRVAASHRRRLLPLTVISILVGGGLTLLVITQGVLALSPWYAPQKLIPLAGMIFSNSMNSVSLATERFFAELRNDTPLFTAKQTALKAALIPITNSLFAVGLVSIPGMMTGQVLSGTDPSIAARYQIMVMCMTFASSGLAASICLSLVARRPDVFQLAAEIQPRGEVPEKTV